MPNFAADKLAAATWARELLDKGNFVILDTETTSLKNAGVVQIGIINHLGETLLDSLVKPDRDIEEGAKAIHGISEEMVKDAPTLDQLAFEIANATDSKTLVIYNKDYDYPILRRLLPLWKHNDVQCAMQAYAEFVGDWNDYHKSYKWQKLPETEGAKAHDALGDCLSVLALLEKMAAFASPQTVDDIPF